MPSNNHHGSYNVTGSGTNPQGNNYDSRSYESGGQGYHYSNADSSFYYSNPNGSTSHESGSGQATYTTGSGQTFTADKSAGDTGGWKRA